MKVSFISLGCPKNTVNSEQMLFAVQQAGHEIVPAPEMADAVIINTCAFIESATQEAINTIIEVGQLKEEGSLKYLIVAGCLAQRYREQIFDELPEVDAVIGTGSLHNIVKAVEEVWAGKKYLSCEPNESLRLGGERVVTTPDYTAYIKVAEGCDNRCSYCAIPAIRGSFRSRPMEDIVEEAKSLETLGVKELVIVAQDTTRYGLDLYGRYALSDLLKRLTAETSIPWFRLLYCYPDKITDELIAEMRENDRVVKYIDIPIQHISDRMLKAMNRHGDGALVRDTVKRLREGVPGITIRTTAIVGFPGETEEDFTELCEYIQEAEFDRFGAFPYSREEDTPAYDLPDQIDEQIKQDRYDELMAIQLEIHEKLNEAKIGKTVTVLCEGFDPVAETCFGRSEADAPEIDGKVYFTAKKRPAEGEFVTVKVTEAIDYDLFGELC